MKSKLLLITLVGCLAGIVSAGTPITDNDFTVERNVENIFANNTVFNTNLSGLTNISSVNSYTSQSGNCDGLPEPPEDDEATIEPSCVDTSDNNPNPPLGGTTHKDAIPFSSSGDYVAKYYMRNPDTGSFRYVGQKPLVSYNGSHFEFDLPNPGRVDGDYAYYRVDILPVTSAITLPISYGHFEVYYPDFEEFPMFR